MILLDHVTKHYPGDNKPALDDISLHISPNEFVFLVGESGAGKSTLLKMITKEEAPDSGKIVIGGIDLDYTRKRDIPNYRRRLGVVFQDYKLLPARTVFENVAFALEIAGMSNQDIERTVPKVLDLVGLSDKSSKFPDQLSGGEQQRVSIARAVARQPKVLIADEPTGNLDNNTGIEIADLLKKINDYGTTVLVTTHDDYIVNHLMKRVVTLKDGKIVSDQKQHGIYLLDGDIDGMRGFHNNGRPIRKPGQSLSRPAKAQPAAARTVAEPKQTIQQSSRTMRRPQSATTRRAQAASPRRRLNTPGRKVI